MPRRLQFHALDYGCTLAFLSYAASTMVVPISLLSLIEEFHFNLGTGGSVETVRTVALCLILISSGFLAARLGAVRSLAAGLLTIAAGLLWLARATSLPEVYAAAFIMGLGAGVTEALINPIVQDVHPEDSGRYLNFVNAFWSIGVVITTLLAGYWLSRGGGWRPVLVAAAALSAATGGFVFILRKSLPHTARPAISVLRAKHAIFRHPHFPAYVFAMFLTGLAEGGLTFWSATYLQLRFETGPGMGGIAIALFAAGMALGRLLWSVSVPQPHMHRALKLSVLGGLLPCGLLPFAPNIASAWLLLFLAGFAIAPLWPVLQSLAAERMQVDHTSLFILLSCAGIPGFAVSAWMIGWIADQSSIAHGMSFVSATMLALAAALHCRQL